MPQTRPRADEWLRNFGYRLRQVREDAGLSQAALADKAGLHVTYVSSMERGRRNVSLVNIHALAEALGVNPGQLLDQAPGRPHD